jgi:ribosomal protein S18 acetylase RimI-like enzyme
MKISPAKESDLGKLTLLFDEYRVFYRCKRAPNRVRSFLENRLQAGDSYILCAFEEEEMLGFTQLYPSFSSTEMKKIWILNDLFVATNARHQGVGGLLLRAARDYARETGASYLSLETQTHNTAAQSLYEKEGWVRDAEFYTYILDLERADSSSDAN